MSELASVNNLETLISENRKWTFDGYEFTGNDVRVFDRVFGNRIVFKNCRFSVALDLSRCHFEKGLVFVGCVFSKEFKMIATKVIGDCQFRACVFEDNANFDRLKVEGKLDVRAPETRKDLKGNIDVLKKYQFEKKPYVIFKKGARFSQIHITGEANFGSVQFWEWTDFYNAKIEGPTFFRTDHCKNYVELIKKGFPHCLRAAKFFSNYCFKPVVFKKGVRFRFAHFGGELNFHGADFSITNGTDEKKHRVDFSFTKCDGVVFFCDPDKEPEDKLEDKYRCNFETDLASSKSSLDFEGASFEKINSFCKLKISIYRFF